MSQIISKLPLLEWGKKKESLLRKLAQEWETLSDTKRGIVIQHTPVRLGGYDAKRPIWEVFMDNSVIYTESMKTPYSSAVMDRMEQGNKFELEIGEIVAQAEGVVIIPLCDRSDESKALREKLTMAAIERKERVIWNARLPFINGRIAEPDMLVFYKDGYVPVDVKHHTSINGGKSPYYAHVSSLVDPCGVSSIKEQVGNGSPRKEDAMQLAHYWEVLKDLGVNASVPLGGIVGKERKIIWYLLDELSFLHGIDGRKKTPVLDIYAHAFSKAWRIAAIAILQGYNPAIPRPPESLPYWDSSCLESPWREQIQFELERRDDISLLPGMTGLRSLPYREVGVTTIRQLSEMDWRGAWLIANGYSLSYVLRRAANGVDPIALIGVRACKRLGISTSKDLLEIDPSVSIFEGVKVWNLTGSIDNARSRIMKTVYRKEWISHVEIPRASIELDLDIEDSEGIVYLIGVWESLRYGKTEKGRYVSFSTWDRTPEGERDVFAQWWAYTQNMRKYAQSRGKSCKTYFYSHHETSSFRKLAEKWKGNPGIPTAKELEALFDSRDWVDMLPKVRDQLVWPTEGYGLKSVAKWCRFDWRDETPGGDNSLVWYELATNSDDPKVRKEMQKRLLTYNEDDVLATKAVRDYLSKRGDPRKAGSYIPAISSVSPRFERKGG